MSNEEDDCRSFELEDSDGNTCQVDVLITTMDRGIDGFKVYMLVECQRQLCAIEVMEALEREIDGFYPDGYGCQHSFDCCGRCYPSKASINPISFVELDEDLGADVAYSWCVSQGYNRNV